MLLMLLLLLVTVCLAESADSVCSASVHTDQLGCAERQWLQ
jgi:hypothetical protein